MLGRREAVTLRRLRLEVPSKYPSFFNERRQGRGGFWEEKEVRQEG